MVAAAKVSKNMTMQFVRSREDRFIASNTYLVTMDYLTGMQISAIILFSG